MARIASYGGTTGSTLTVKLTESIVINDKNYGSAQTFTIDAITNIDRRILKITDTEATIYTTGAAMGPGTYIAAKVQYIRITNLDDAKNVTLTLANENDDEMAIVLHENQKSFMLVSDGTTGMVDMFDAKDSALSYSLGDIKSITALCEHSNGADIEIFIAEKA
tara:strand:+ start:289 stop:780 length:492 start_codon:yes stop_codon:yes gene_type:complete